MQTFTVGATEIINQAISNDVRANYSNSRVGIRYALDDFGGAGRFPTQFFFPLGFPRRIAASHSLSLVRASSLTAISAQTSNAN